MPHGGAFRPWRPRAARLALGLAGFVGLAPSARAEEACPGVACAADAARIRYVRFEGSGALRMASLRARTAFLIGQPATEENLIKALAALGEEPDLGAVGLRVVRSDRDRSSGELVVSVDPRVRRIKAFGITTSAQGAPDAEETWRLIRQIRAEDRALLLAEGRPLHPIALKLDEDLLRRVWQRKGYRDVVIRSETEPSGDLVDVVLRVAEGPRYTVHSVVIDGPRVESDEERETLLERLATRANDEAPLVPWHLTDDAERVRRHYCRRGYADARVDVRQALADRTGVDVGFQVLPGGLSTIGAVTFDGDGLSANARKQLPVAEGRPYCGDLLAETQAAAMAWLRDHGHPDAVVEVTAAPMPGGAMGPRRVSVLVRVAADAEVKVTRIWFEGNANTREDVLRQMLAVEEGDVYRERDLQTSVQNLLRSGLFRQADVQTIGGAERGERYLTFSVVERDPVSIDLLDQSLTLRNLDLTAWPADFDELSAGAAFRGAGHELRVTGRSNRIGVRFRNLFLHRYMLTEAEFAWRTQAVGAEDEQWFGAEWGLGVKFFENRLALVPFVALEITDLPRRAVFDPLPLAQGQHVEVLAGATGRADINLRDQERIPYLGVDTTVRYTHAVPPLGGELDWHGLDARAALNLPIGENSVGAHYILRLSGRYGHIWTDEPGHRMAAHQRLTPTIRGYESDAIGVPFDGTRTDAGGVIGGDRVALGSVELRVPIRPLRRNALAPFVDAATVAGEGDPLLDRLHAAAGAAYYFSFFSERLEGFLYGAVPFRTSSAWQVLGAGVGGNF